MGRVNSQIKGGIDNGLQWSGNTFVVSNSANVPETLEVTLPFAQTSLYGMVTNASSTLKNLIIHTNNTITSLERFLFRRTTVQTVTLDFDTSSVTNWTYFCDGMTGLTVIDGIPLNLSSATTTFDLNSYSLKDIMFAENTISVSCSANACKSLTAESYESFFAALQTISTAKTLILDNHAKTRGKITQTQIDEATAKGWTLAFYN